MSLLAMLSEGMQIRGARASPMPYDGIIVVQHFFRVGFASSSPGSHSWKIRLSHRSWNLYLNLLLSESDRKRFQVQILKIPLWEEVLSTMLESIGVICGASLPSGGALHPHMFPF